MTKQQNLGSPNWLTKFETQTLFDLVEAGGGELRVVGGCVRDSLRDPSGGDGVEFDIDMACNLSPDRLIEIFSAAGLKTIPTGIAHGTISVIVAGNTGDGDNNANNNGDKSIYEITTLRKDVITDGRHAQVEITDDWVEDARRRDFTINALYADRNGQVYDWLADEGFSGLIDLEANRVRFIGEPAARISEDYLRILRFFRFHFRLAPSLPLDANSLAACGAAADEIPRLSGERICAELLQILALPSAFLAMRAMQDAGVLKHVLANAGEFARLEKLVQIFDAWNIPNAADPILRLSTCLAAPENEANNNQILASEIAQALRLSRRSADRLKQFLACEALAFEAKGRMPNLDLSLTSDRLRQALFLIGDKSALLDQILLAWAADPRATPVNRECQVSSAWKRQIDCLHKLELPVFPLTGAMLIDMGLASGPNMGNVLKETQGWWCDANFKPDLSDLQAYAASIMQLP